MWPELVWLTRESSYQHEKYKAYLSFPSFACIFITIYDWQKDQSDTYACLYLFSNYGAANLLVGTTRPILVQRLRRACRSVI
jgi:hypothetical protein